MATRHRTIKTTWLFSVVFIGIILTACNGARTIQQPSSSTLDTIQETTVEPTQLPSPTSPPGKVWLITPPGSDEELVNQLKSKLEELTIQQGYLLDQKDNLSQNQLDQSTKVVVWIGDNTDIANLAETAPQTQFILVGPSQAEPTANLSIIRTSSERISFMAGFIATLVAPDRRSGGLFLSDDPLNGLLQDSFVNGGAYLCGRCTPLYAPVVFFPVTGTVSLASGLDGLKVAFDSLNQNRIEVIYIPSQAAIPDFLSYLSGLGVIVISTGEPLDGFINQWVTTISQDPASALSRIWPQLLIEDAPGQALNASTIFTNVNDQFLTPGKLEFAEKVAAELDNGWIEPLSVP